MVECKICSDTGMEIVTGKGARICEHRKEIIRLKKYAAIPPKFRAVTIDSIQPMPQKHGMQGKVIDALKSDPTGSYVLCGKFGTGKSLFLWALYRHAIETGERKVICCTLAELLNEFRMCIQASMNGNTPILPRVNATELRQTETKYAIFFDDIDKARPTEYAAEQLFEIINAIYEFQHQLVVTTNLRSRELIDHFDKADSRYGGAIVRRMTDGAKIVEMF